MIHHKWPVYCLSTSFFLTKIQDIKWKNWILFIEHNDCEECGKTFHGGNAKRRLANHMKKHQEKPIPDYKCHFCNKDYKSKAVLQRHKRMNCPEHLAPNYFAWIIPILYLLYSLLWNHYCDWNMELSLWLKYEITIVIKLLLFIYVKTHQ